MENYEEQPVLTRQTNWDVLFFYQKSDVIYQLSVCLLQQIYTPLQGPHT